LTNIRFSMASTLPHAVAIPQGTRISPDGQLMFETTEYLEIVAGNLFADVPAQCQTAGIVGNNLLPGQIAKVVDPIPYVSTISNTTTTTGGADVEKDDPYRARIQLAPESFSVAGPTMAYAHWAKSAHQDIVDIAVYKSSGLDGLSRANLEIILGVFGINPASMTDEQARIAVGDNVKASVVNVCALLKSGGIPDQTILDLVAKKVNNRTIRPLTDQVIVKAPGAVNYSVNLTYYILDSNSLMVSEIQAKIITAVGLYVTWQKEILGRDVNPEKLISMVMDAGAHRVTITGPTYAAVGNDQVAISTGENINYGGLVNE